MHVSVHTVLSERMSWVIPIYLVDDIFVPWHLSHQSTDQTAHNAPGYSEGHGFSSSTLSVSQMLQKVKIC